MSFFRAVTRRGLPHHPATARLFSTTTSRADLARVQVIGNIGTEPEISQTSAGSPMIKYSVASNLGSADKKTTQWHRVVAFNEPNPDRLAKGSRVFLEGDLRISTYDGEDGKKLTSVSIIQRSLSILSKPRGESTGEGEA
ncbi:hypothetical protein ABW20_dc0102739 [Dactylellina cionopaga]|nr:hypothetical protein ABW20_dc0102739 [Dactylellina cionopaga]